MPAKPDVIWAYAYRLDPPQPALRLRGVKALLEREHREAIAREATWEGRLVSDDRISHVLILSDTPDLTGPANRRLEIALQLIDARYVLTVPMVVPVESVDDPPPKD